MLRKLILAVAAVVGAAILVPVVAEASTNLNSSRSNFQRGITVIPDDPASRKACKDQGGKVEKQDGKTVCDVP